jgi:SAM-dependent methyltransferase
MTRGTIYPWLSLCCPECFEKIDREALRCKNGHQFNEEHGVVSLLGTEMDLRLHSFLDKFEDFRSTRGMRGRNPAWFQELPYGPMAKGSFEWRIRQAGWEIIKNATRNLSGLRILDFGAWNGWLSHRLAALGHQVVSVDYFVDPLDGLGAKMHYDVDWSAIQMDLEDLSILPAAYDMVIVNHCLQFYSNLSKFLEGTRRLLVENGTIQMIGLSFFADPSKQIERVQAYRADFQNHGFDFFKPVKGYLDFEDRMLLKREGISLHPYRALWKANFRSRVDRTKPRYEFGRFTKGQ